MACSSSTQLVTITLVTLLFIQFQKGSYSATFTTINKCSYPIWPGVLSADRTSTLPTTGFSLQPGESNAIPVPASWSGRLWGRTLCSQDSTGKFSCVTGDYAGGIGSTTQVVATLAEFTLNGTDGPSFFEVSLVNGFNLPMKVVPRGGNCSATGCGCPVDLNEECPAELKVKSEGEVVACKPSFYSEFFKSACPLANVDGTTISNNYTCACVSADHYLIIFCPTPASPSSVKPGNEKYPTAPVEKPGGYVHGSTIVVKAIIYALVSSVVTPVVSFFVIKIAIFCRNRDRGTGVVRVEAETSPVEINLGLMAPDADIACPNEKVNYEETMDSIPQV